MRRGDGNNLPNAMVEQGARTAIGFTGEIDCDKANEWTKIFYDYLLAGNTVFEAVKEASDGKDKISGVDIESVVICGDKSFKLVD